MTGKSRRSTVGSTINAIVRWLPTVVDRRVRVAAWLSLVSQILIVVTGGAVRLTGSGLGCPTWPSCTPESLIATPEMGIHGVIEFGNRLLTFVLVVIAIAMFLLVMRLRRERRDLFAPALLLGLGIPAQAIIGGITVLTGLNPWVVGLHFVLSIALVSIATVLVWRVYRGRVWNDLEPALLRRLSLTTSLFVMLTILAGIATTGSGPHAGDHGAARNGLDSEFLQHVHSWPAYITLALTVALIALAHTLRRPRVRTLAVALLGVELVQVAVGIAQSRLGLPALLVGIHMLLACVLASVMTAVVLAANDRQHGASAERARTEEGDRFRRPERQASSS